MESTTIEVLETRVSALQREARESERSGLWLSLGYGAGGLARGRRLSSAPLHDLAKARAMQHWIDRSGIAHRPMPKLGPSAEEIEARDREASVWGLETGAVREIAQAYRRARHSGDSDLTAFNAVADVAQSLGRPLGESRIRRAC